MSFHVADGSKQGDNLDKPSLAPNLFTNETRKASCAAGDVCGRKDGVSALLERALLTTDRDSALRRKYLRKRWHGEIEKRQPRDKPHLHPTPLELWWSRRLRTPLGRALMRLNSN